MTNALLFIQLGSEHPKRLLLVEKSHIWDQVILVEKSNFWVFLDSEGEIDVLQESNIY